MKYLKINHYDPFSAALLDAAQVLLAELRPRFNFIQGDVAMLVMDVPPEIPPQYAPVLVAEAPKTPAPASLERTIGVCHLIDNRSELVLGAVNTFTPVQTVNYYFNRLEGNYLGLKGTTTLLEGPKHGSLESDADGNYLYIAKSDYIGPDQATFLVEIGGYRVKAVYHFNVMPGVPGGTEGYDPMKDKELCPKGYVWKISLNPDDPNAPIYTFEHPSQLTSPYAGLSNVNLSFGTLAPGALGQTTGSTITLDPRAAGFGWFIDTTPWDNSEYLPTHDPEVWVAREGSDAAGKMDMLSVLLHEYGHVLGIDQSSRRVGLRANPA